MNLKSSSPTRTRAREFAFQFLYQVDHLKTQGLEDSMKAFRTHVEHFRPDPETIEFAERLIIAVLKNLNTIDQTLVPLLEHWRMERLSAMDRALIRMGTAELIYFKDVPASVTLNEIVELGKKFGEQDSAGFLNGVLDPVSKLPEAIDGKIPSDPSVE